eukprot:gene17755-biopygen826
MPKNGWSRSKSTCTLQSQFFARPERERAAVRTAARQPHYARQLAPTRRNDKTTIPPHHRGAKDPRGCAGQRHPTHRPTLYAEFLWPECALAHQALPFPGLTGRTRVVPSLDSPDSLGWEKRQRTWAGRRPGAGDTIDCEETDAGRARTRARAAPFLLLSWGKRPGTRPDTVGTHPLQILSCGTLGGAPTRTPVISVYSSHSGSLRATPGHSGILRATLGWSVLLRVTPYYSGLLRASVRLGLLGRRSGPGDLGDYRRLRGTPHKGYGLLGMLYAPPNQWGGIPVKSGGRGPGAGCTIDRNDAKVPAPALRFFDPLNNKHCPPRGECIYMHPLRVWHTHSSIPDAARVHIQHAPAAASSAAATLRRASPRA